MERVVACVLRSGGVYGPEWVQALRKGLDDHLPGSSLVCLTDMEVIVPGVEVHALYHGFPGWWSKVELFRPGVFDGPVLYLDLDTLPVGDLSDIAGYSGELAVLSDFYQPQRMASGVMAFTPGPRTEAVYHAFVDDPEGVMRSNRSRSDYWYAEHMEPDRLQDVFPGQIVSYKAHARHEAPEGARLVCGHGRPRFSSTDSTWAHVLWIRRAA